MDENYHNLQENINSLDDIDDVEDEDDTIEVTFYHSEDVNEKNEEVKETKEDENEICQQLTAPHSEDIIATLRFQINLLTIFRFIKFVFLLVY